jgi:hypothetical protein
MDFKEFLRAHIKRRPLLRVRDVYKLIFQGVFGVGHIMGEDAYERLSEEASRISLEDHKWEPLIEPANPEETIIRVNLRPFLRKKGNLRSLYEAMLESSKKEGKKEQFMELWNNFKRLNSEEDLGFDTEQIREHDLSIEKNGIKPQHHSEPYRQAYYPAYRVVIAEIFEKKTDTLEKYQ